MVHYYNFLMIKTKYSTWDSYNVKGLSIRNKIIHLLYPNVEIDYNI